MQTVTVEISTCPLKLTYDRNVRREGESEEAQKELWLLKVALTNTTLEPWLLITDWAVEDAFKYTKSCLGLEEVQLLDLEGIRVLVALAWVAAGFLYEMGVTMEWPEIQFLAYVHNAEDQIRGEAATLSFFSEGQYTNPMVIRIAGLDDAARLRAFGFGPSAAAIH